MAAPAGPGAGQRRAGTTLERRHAARRARPRAAWRVPAALPRRSRRCGAPAARCRRSAAAPARVGDLKLAEQPPRLIERQRDRDVVLLAVAGEILAARPQSRGHTEPAHAGRRRRAARSARARPGSRPQAADGSWPGTTRTRARGTRAPSACRGRSRETCRHRAWLRKYPSSRSPMRYCIAPGGPAGAAVRAASRPPAPRCARPADACPSRSSARCPDVEDAPVAADHDVLRRDSQVEGLAEPSVVEHDRHREVHAAAIGAHVLSVSLKPVLIAITTRSAPALRNVRSRCGICSRHGTHHVAQNFR